MAKRKRAATRGAAPTPKRKKTGGRKPGSLNVATKEAKAFAESLITRPLYLARLCARFDAGTVSDRIETLMWHYAKGVPKQSVDLVARVTLEDIVAGVKGGS